MRIVHADGVAGAAAARGVVVVIDVIRAFTVSAYALAGGAGRCLLVGDVEQALALQARLPGALVSAEVDGLPVAGIAISNSPSMVSRADLGGRTLIQRTSAGTPAARAAAGAERLFAASLAVAGATARAVARRSPALVTLVASGGPEHLEDGACARFIEARLEGREPDLEALLAPFRAGARYRRFAAGEQPGFPPEDLELALRADAFDFAMLIETGPAGALTLARAAD